MARLSYFVMSIVKLLYALSFIVAVFLAKACSFSGTIIEEWEASNNTIKIRVQKRPDTYLRYQYIFQFASDDSNEWHDIFVHVQDDPDPIPRDQVRFVTDQICYLFMGAIWAVTRNNGRDWSVFNLDSDTDWGRKNPNIYWIRDLEIKPDGSGLLTLRVYEGYKLPPAYYSTDFGQHWFVKE